MNTNMCRFSLTTRTDIAESLTDWLLNVNYLNSKRVGILDRTISFANIMSVVHRNGYVSNSQ